MSFTVIHISKITSMKRKQRQQRYQRRQQQRQRLWTANKWVRWAAMECASVTFVGMVEKGGGGLRLLARPWDLVKAFAVPSDEQILGYKRAWAQRIHCTRTIETGHTLNIWAIAASPTGNIVTTSWDRTSKIWTREGTFLHSFTGHSDWIFAVAATLNGFVTGSGDGTAKVWGPEGECLQTLTGHTGHIMAVAVLPDGKIVTGS